MKRIGEMMRGRPATDAEHDTVNRVVGLSLRWQTGEITLEEVRQQSTGFERFTAVRFADLGSQDKAEIMALLDALVELDDERRRNEREREDQYQRG